MSVGVIQGGAWPKPNELFIRYMNVMDRSDEPNWDRVIGGEIEHLLRRLDWLLHQIRSADLEYNYRFTPDCRFLELSLAIPTLTDSWYYNAFRAMRLISGNCPGLKSLEIRNITFIRNNLIEHPYRKNAGNVYNPNFSTGTPDGPQVKGPRWDGQSDAWRDPGVFATAGEFAEALVALLQPFWKKDIEWMVAQQTEGAAEQ